MKPSREEDFGVSCLYPGNAFPKSDCRVAASARPVRCVASLALHCAHFRVCSLQSATTRRPYVIHETVRTPAARWTLFDTLPQHCDAILPLNLDQRHLADTPELHGRPQNQPTEHRK